MHFLKELVDKLEWPLHIITIVAFSLTVVKRDERNPGISLLADFTLHQGSEPLLLELSRLIGRKEQFAP